MKQLSILLLFSVIISVSHAQDKVVYTIVKKWKLIEIEEFGSKYPLTDNQKDDFIEFNAEKKYSGLLNGKEIVGGWVEKLGKYTLTPNKEKSNFKVNWIRLISLDADNLVLMYQSEDLIKTTLFYKKAE